MVTASRTRGFTLLEVLIALVVLALSLGAVIKATGDYTNIQSWLRDRTLATWVARNVRVEFQLEGEWPGVGEKKGTRELGNREWRWLARISQTEEEQLRRLDVEVSPVDADDTEPFTTLSGFLRQPDS